MREDQLSEAYLLPLRAASEPYVRSFQYKVLNYILYTNDRFFKIGYVINPNCTFCKENRETIHHILFECSFSKWFWSECLLIRDIMIGILKKGMDLIHYKVNLGKRICGPVGVNA